MKQFLAILTLCCITGTPFAQSVQDDAGRSAPGQSASAAAPELPLKRLALFSSGVGFFEHAGRIGGTAARPASFTLPFNAAAVNDVLKSLVIKDPLSSSPSVRYPSEQTLVQTLRSLSIDLSDDPGIGDILNGLKGAELKITAPMAIEGRIIGVEFRASNLLSELTADEPWLSLFTASGIRVITVKDISSFSFKDEKINADLHRALDLIMASRDRGTRNLLVTLPGTGSRDISLSYVIPVPVWKASYRLDLGNSAAAGGGQKPFIQGWAIVDNDSDTDWKEVILSLVTGRPISFIQNLYAPYRLSRPVLPLAIAGIAESRTYDSGWGGTGFAEEKPAAKSAAQRDMNMLYEAEEMVQADSRDYERRPNAPSVARPVVPAPLETANAAAAGDQFEFTLKNAVTLERRQSAMLPLVEGAVQAEKVLVFPGAKAAGVTIHPALSAELTNTTGMRLPAGPITVYDGGTYAGDALIEFFPENEKRLVSFGDDLSVTGSAALANTRDITAVKISRGVMTISRRQSYERVYTVKNSSAEAKRIIIEHPVTAGTTLAEPPQFDERTAGFYRFTRPLPGRGELVFTVREELPLSEQVVLAQTRASSFVAYASSQEIPAAARAALQKAVELQQKADEAAAAQKEKESDRTRLVSEQDRIRRNLEAAGNQTPQGQDYLKRLVTMDAEIDALNQQIAEAAKTAEAARKAYNDYLQSIEL